jgi:hypothetical protein
MAREHRFRRLKEMGCAACFREGIQDVPAEIHHLNGGGHAGQKRRGDEFTVPLCIWHHRGVLSQNVMWAQPPGPSLARHSREFRQRYGRDDALLARVNRRIAKMDALALGAFMATGDAT